jgi:hypothetical protein
MGPFYSATKQTKRFQRNARLSAQKISFRVRKYDINNNLMKISIIMPSNRTR